MDKIQGDSLSDMNTFFNSFLLNDLAFVSYNNHVHIPNLYIEYKMVVKVEHISNEFIIK